MRGISESKMQVDILGNSTYTWPIYMIFAVKFFPEHFLVRKWKIKEYFLTYPSQKPWTATFETPLTLSKHKSQHIEQNDCCVTVYRYNQSNSVQIVSCRPFRISGKTVPGPSLAAYEITRSKLIILINADIMPIDWLPKTEIINTIFFIR